MNAQCPICGQVLEVPDLKAGTIGRCQACKGLYRMSASGRLVDLNSAKGGGSAGRPSDSRDHVRYKCGQCKTKLESSADQAGQEEACPVCGHTNAVPAGKRRDEPANEAPASRQPAPQGDESYALAPDDSPPAQHSALSSTAPGDGQGLSLDVHAATSAGTSGLAIAEPPPASAPPGMHAGGQWYYISGSEQIGPVSLAVIRELVHYGQLHANSTVWRDGMPRWGQLGTTPEFLSMIAAAGPGAATRPPTSAAKSHWPIPVGIISIVLASLGIACLPFTAASLDSPFYPRWVETFLLLSMVATLVQVALLLAAGITLLARRRASGGLHIAYAWIAIAIRALETALLVMAIVESRGDPYAENVASLFLWVLVGLAVTLSYPIFLLAWFMRGKIRSEVASWGRST